MKRLILFFIFAAAAAAQCGRTAYNLTSGGPDCLGNDARKVASLPATCAVGDLAYLTTGSIGLYGCDATNTWTLRVAKDSSGNVAIGTTLLVSIANESGTGTTQYKLAKLTGAPSTAIIAGTTDTEGIIGIVQSGAGTTGSAGVARFGIGQCVFDAATTAGHYVQISPTVAGDCHDAGASRPASGQILGYVLSTNGSGGTYSVLIRPDITAGGATAPTINAQTNTTYSLQASDCGNVVTLSNASDITLTVPAGLSIGCAVTVIQLGLGTVTPTASSTTINQRWAYTKTSGQHAVAYLISYATNVWSLSGDLQ